MAHFAKLDENNKVTDVIVVDNSVLLDDNGEEQESLGLAFLADLYPNTTWKQCSYNASFRLVYPGQGSFYIPEHDIFTYPKLFNSWVLDTNTGQYNPPIPLPDYVESTHEFIWDEESLSWVFVLKAFVNVT